MSALCTSEATPGDVKEVKRVAQHERRKRFDMATATANLKLKRKPRPASMRSSMAFSITSPLDSPLQRAAVKRNGPPSALSASASAFHDSKGRNLDLPRAPQPSPQPPRPGIRHRWLPLRPSCRSAAAEVTASSWTARSVATARRARAPNGINTFYPVSPHPRTLKLGERTKLGSAVPISKFPNLGGQ